MRRLPRQSEADAIIDEPLDQLACAVTSRSRCQLVLTWASAMRGVGRTVPAGPVGFDVLSTAYALIVESVCTDRSTPRPVWLLKLEAPATAGAFIGIESRRTQRFSDPSGRS
ncbi:hypothetical protein XHV734_4401 [Xanthomonas hortorum pv. vitians]|nr:hypothetical protein XHV734_4401 [Xanthomonas hortorum pv. vitians]